MIIRWAIVVSTIFVASPSLAWNALGHKIIAEIAWQELDPTARAEIVATLRRHPRFDTDFARRIEQDVDEAHWIFLNAATWPDLARNLPRDERARYDHPTWHYVNVPLALDGIEAPPINVAVELGDAQVDQWNVAQAIAYCRDIIDSDRTAQTKSLAYCWLFHLVGDLHQPMHSTALFCRRFPKGDRGGNSIRVAQGGNLHALWDELPGSDHKMRSVGRRTDEVVKEFAALAVDATPNVDAWVNESHTLAVKQAYHPEILAAVRREGPLQKVWMPESYLREAGGTARRQVYVAGLRLAALLGAPPHKATPAPSPPTPANSLVAQPPRTTAGPVRPSSSLTHWLNVETNVRHNEGCRFYQKVKLGRACAGDEGVACGICGG